jgi:hypothetical protein
MKTPNQFLFAAMFLGVILLALLLMPVSVQATNTGNDLDWSDAASVSALNCPAGVKPSCVPQRVGATVVLCKQGDEVQGYTSISDYCLSCHATSRPMAFEHPREIEYPASRREFREPGSLHESIVLDAGDLTCKTCHSGIDAGNHFLADKYDSTHICGHCHMTGIDCPSKKADQQSVCFPGMLNGEMRCLTGQDVILHLSTSEYCSDCHGDMSKFHSVDVEYPVNNRNFTPIADLDPLIKLEEGRITCESCHEKAGEGMMLCNHCHPK